MPPFGLASCVCACKGAERGQDRAPTSPEAMRSAAERRTAAKSLNVSNDLYTGKPSWKRRGALRSGVKASAAREEAHECAPSASTGGSARDRHQLLAVVQEKLLAPLSRRLSRRRARVVVRGRAALAQLGRSSVSGGSGCSCVSCGFGLGLPLRNSGEHLVDVGRAGQRRDSAFDAPGALALVASLRRRRRCGAAACSASLAHGGLLLPHETTHSRKAPSQQRLLGVTRHERPHSAVLRRSAQCRGQRLRWLRTRSPTCTQRGSRSCSKRGGARSPERAAQVVHPRVVATMVCVRHRTIRYSAAQKEEKAARTPLQNPHLQAACRRKRRRGAATGARRRAAGGRLHPCAPPAASLLAPTAVPPGARRGEKHGDTARCQLPEPGAVLCTKRFADALRLTCPRRPCYRGVVSAGLGTHQLRLL